MKKYQALIITLLIIALLPFCYMCLYAFPFADDFCIGWELLQGKPLLTSIAEQYMYWNGRYTSDVLINLHPIATGSLSAYSIVILLSLLLTPLVFYVLAIQVLKHRTTSIIVSMMLCLLYLNYMPQLTEGIYWYGGIVNYHIGAMVLLLQLSVFMKLYEAIEKRLLLYALSLLLLALSVGFNEVGAVLIPLFYFTALLIQFKAQTDNRNLIAVHFTVAVFASAFVIFSPGNATRLGEFNDKYNFFHSTYYASLQTIRFSGTWILSYTFIVCSLLTVLYANKLRDSLLNKTDWRLALAGALGVVFIAAFIPYFATGILGQHRTINYVYPFFLLLWFTALIDFANRHPIHIPFLKTDRAKVVVLISAIMVLSFTGNSILIWKDTATDKFSIYKEEYIARQQQILNGDTIIKPLQHIPNAFMITDAAAKGDPQYWVNKCMMLYYEKDTSGLK